MASIQGLYIKSPVVACCSKHGHPLWRRQVKNNKDGKWYCPKCGDAPPEVIWEKRTHKEIHRPSRVRTSHRTGKRQ